MKLSICRKAAAALLASAPVLSSLAVADMPTLPSRSNDFSFSHVQAGLETGDWENPRADLDSFFVDGAHALDEHIFLRGGLAWFDGRSRGGGPGRVDVDGHRIYGGLGFNTPLEQDLDLVLSGDLVRVRARFDNGSGTEMGFDLRGGVRYRANERVELSGGAFFEKIDRSEFALYGEGIYQLDAPVNAGARLVLGDDMTTFGLLVRYDF